MSASRKTDGLKHQAEQLTKLIFNLIRLGRDGRFVCKVLILNEIKLRLEFDTQWLSRLF